MLSGNFWLRIGVGGVVGNIPDAVQVAGGMLGGLSVIFPTLFKWRAACWEGCR
jgi:hypothetical protein